MTIERNLLISLLKLTKDGVISHDLVKKDAKLPSQILARLLQKLQTDGLVYVRKLLVETSSQQRLRLAIRAITLGADLEKTSSLLDWREFEGFAAYVLERNGYSVTRNLRFRDSRCRWEIDIVGCRRPNVICIDCKHWHQTLHRSSLKKIVQEQTKRCKAFSRIVSHPLVKIECRLWDRATFVPAILSLLQGNCRFYDSVPVVPIFQLQDFLEKLPAHTCSIRHFSVSSYNLQDRLA